MNFISKYIHSSIGKKQIVAVTGLILVLFVIGHLAGNLFIYGGPQAFNHYAEKLAGLRPALTIVEFGLLFIFLTHIYFTVILVLDNIRARGVPYTVNQPVGKRSLTTKLMPYTGTYLLAFIIWHLCDFTFTNHHAAEYFINGEDHGLYGVVYHAFANPWHSAGYIFAMGCLGFHLSHGIQSIFQTRGCNDATVTPLIQNVSNFLGCLIAFGYSTIPLLILFHNAKYHLVN